MAEPLKNQFGPEVIERIGDLASSVLPGFDQDQFRHRCLDGYEELELTERSRQISDALAEHLPADRGEAIELIIDGLPFLQKQIDDGLPAGLAGFVYHPLVRFVQDHGLADFDTAMDAQYELTQLFTAEFSLRPFLETYPDATLERLHHWTGDESEHIRRLVSEGTRPRLPWAPILRAFQADPTPVLALLEKLKDDTSEYVRRSVANNLNDIAKDHSDLVVAIAERWWPDGDDKRHRLIRHGLRTLVKRGDPGALAVLGYGVDTPATVESAAIEPATPSIGGKVQISVSVANPTKNTIAVLVDLEVHFVKKSGASSAKIFKGAELEIGPKSAKTFSKTVSLKQHSTRTHYPGTHRVGVVVNGTALPLGQFELTSLPETTG